MSLLENIVNHLDRTGLDHEVLKESHGFRRRHDFGHKIEIGIVSTEEFYSIDDRVLDLLNRQISDVADGIKKKKRNSRLFRLSGERLEHGYLTYDEKMAPSEVEKLSNEFGKTLINNERFISINFYPNNSALRHVKDDDKYKFSMDLQELRRLQPGYTPSLIEHLQGISESVRKRISVALRPYIGLKDEGMQLFYNRLYKSEIPTDLLFTLEITDKCTLRCRHCFADAGPDKNTFLDTDRVVRLAEESVELFQKYPFSTIRVTGGEPLLHPGLFAIVSAFSDKQESLGYYSLDVETNGWWATNDKKTREIVRKLKGAGASILSMSLDYWHSESDQFDNDEHFYRIKAIAEEEEIEFRSIVPPDPLFTKGVEEDITEVTPIGRARKLPEEYWGNHMLCRPRGCRLLPPNPKYLKMLIGTPYILTKEVTITPDGIVYPCNSGRHFEPVSLALGNIYDNNLSDIISNKNPLVELILKKGLRGVSKLAGLSLREHFELYDKMSPCGLCHELQREYGEAISAKLKT